MNCLGYLIIRGKLHGLLVRTLGEWIQSGLRVLVPRGAGLFRRTIDAPPTLALLDALVCFGNATPVVRCLIGGVFVVFKCQRRG